MYTSPIPRPLVAPGLLLALHVLLPAAQAAERGREERLTDEDSELTAAGGVVAVRAGDQVTIHDRTGRLVARLPGRARRPSSEAIAGGNRLPPDDARERLWDRLDVPEELRDSDAAEDLAEDELLLSERRPTSPVLAAPTDERQHQPARVTAVGTQLLVMAGGQLHRAEGDRSPVPLGPVPPGARVLAAIAQGTVFVGTESALFISAPDARGWRVLLREPRPEALVAHPDGDWVAFTSTGRVVIVEPSGRRTLHRAPAVRALAVCGGGLALLDAEGLAVTGPGRTLERRSGPLAAEQLVCSADGGGPWLAAGPGLLVSSDGGRSFRPRRDLPAARVVSAALASDRLWLWIPSLGGLVPLPLREGPPILTPTAAPSLSDWTLPERPGWMRLLPRVGILASHLEREGISEQRALAFAELPLSAAPPPLPRRTEAPPFVLAQVTPSQPLPYAPPPGDPRQAAWTAREASCLPDTRTAAARLAGADPERAQSFVRRAGRSAWLPELRFRVEKRLGRSESLDVKPTSAADALGLDTDNDVRYELRATWDLPRLVFHPEEVAAAHQALRMADMRREIESQVNRLYFERRRLVALGGDAIDEVERGIRLEEIGAELDALSQGSWSRCLQQGRRQDR